MDTGVHNLSDFMCEHRLENVTENPFVVAFKDVDPGFVQSMAVPNSGSICHPWPICYCSLMPTTASIQDELTSEDLKPAIASSTGQSFDSHLTGLQQQVEVLEQLVGPNHWARKVKSRKALILRCHFRQKNKQQHGKEPSFVIKILGQEYTKDAAREIAMMKRLKHHPHVIRCPSHFTDEQSRPNMVLVPAASCDLADLILQTSDSIQILKFNKHSAEDTEYEVPTRRGNSPKNKTWSNDISYDADNSTWPLEAPLHHQIRGLLSLMPCLCSALLWVHQAGICHRDIKPENILIAPSGEAVLADFGSARETSELTSWPPYASTKHCVGFGKKYMAPEVWMLESAHTELSDIFSLGIVFTEILTLGALRTVQSFEEFRLEEAMTWPWWKQPVYALTIERCQLWLRSLHASRLSAGVNPQLGERQEEFVNRIIEEIARMINRVPEERSCLESLFHVSSTTFRDHCGSQGMEHYPPLFLDKMQHV